MKEKGGGGGGGRGVDEMQGVAEDGERVGGRRRGWLEEA